MSLLRRFSYSVVAAGLVLVVAEGIARAGLRLAVAGFVGAPEVRDYLANMQLTYDPELGWVPAAVGKDVDSRAVGFDYVGVTPTPAPGRLRGIALGDSQTRGAGVLFEQAWPRAAERILQERGYDVEILNAGQPGWRSRQALRFIETVGLAYHPDFLVVDCMVHDGPAGGRDYARAPNPLTPWLFESRLYRVLWLGISWARDENLGVVTHNDVEQALGADQDGPGAHADLVALARARGIDLVFVDYPVHHGGDRVSAAAPPEALPPGVPVARASEHLAASGRPPSELFFDLNHMTVEGSRLTAEAVADTLQPILDARR